MDHIGSIILAARRAYYNLAAISLETGNMERATSHLLAASDTLESYGDRGKGAFIHLVKEINADYNVEF